MPTLYSVIRRPLITEKGLGVKETEGTLVFDVAPNASKTEVKQAVEDRQSDGTVSLSHGLHTSAKCLHWI